jgi:hypothetical protein
MFAKDKARVPDHVNLQIKDSLNPCLAEAPQGIAKLGSIPGLGSELLLQNTKAGHVTVTYQQWQGPFS